MNFSKKDEIFKIKPNFYWYSQLYKKTFFDSLCYWLFFKRLRMKFLLTNILIRVFLKRMRYFKLNSTLSNIATFTKKTFFNSLFYCLFFKRLRMKFLPTNILIRVFLKRMRYFKLNSTISNIATITKKLSSIYYFTACFSNILEWISSDQ